MNVRHSALSVSLSTLFALSTSAQAQAQAQAELDTTKVQSEASAEIPANEKTMDATALSEASITNIEDTARYVAGIQVNDTGNRFGSDGFNIRGFSGDAVAVTVDGVAQGETLNPASFAAYGMFGSSRSDVEVEHVKTVTISRGPSAVDNGSGALAGAVTYVTNDAADFVSATGDDTAGRVKTGFDSRSNEWLIHGSVANRTGQLETLLQFTRRQGNETQAHNNGADIVGPARGQADPFDITSNALLFKLAYHVNDQTQMGVVYEKSDRSNDGSPLSREPNEGESGSYWNFGAKDENNRERFGVFLKQDNANQVFYDSLSVAIDYQELYTSGITDFLYSRGGPAILRAEDRNFEQDTLNVTADLTKTFHSSLHHVVEYGFNYQDTAVENIMYDRRYNGETSDADIVDGYPIRDQGFVPKTDKSLFSVYLADTISITDQVNLRLGGRYDSTKFEPELDEGFSDPTGQSVSDASFNALIGEVGISYEFAEGHQVIAKAVQGYKAPTMQELYFGTNSGEEITDSVTGLTYADLDEIANPNLDPEESVSYEVRYLGEFEHGELSINVFRTNYKHLIQSETFSTPYGTDVTTESCSAFTGECVTEITTLDTYTQAQNTGEVSVQGIEVSGSYFFTPNVSGRFSYSSLNGEYESEYTPASEADFDFYDKGDDLETLAPDSAVVSLGYRSDDRDWGIEAHMVYSDGVNKSTQKSFTSLNNGSGPFYYPASYTVFDLTAYFDITENLRLTGAIYNLTDKEYYRWSVVQNLRAGNGGFFSGVSDNGYQRFSEPGRSASVYISYTF